MTELSKVELRRLDLTLLLVFLGLVRQRKASLVAADLGLTQSAISQALKRLRTIFGDELFLRRPHGLEPTAVALGLEQPIAQAVDTLRGALVRARDFDPAQVEGIVRIAAFDSAQAVLIPLLATRLRRLAPGLRLSVLPQVRGAALEVLGDGRADLALGLIWDVPDQISCQRLYEETYLVAGRPSALPAAPSLDLDAYCAADHILVSPAGDLRGIVDSALQARGRRRRVGMALPAFLPALAAAAASDALVTLPARVARAFAPTFGLAIAEPPIPIRRFPVSVFWHRRNDADPRTIWLRSELAICAEL